MAKKKNKFKLEIPTGKNPKQIKPYDKGCCGKDGGKK